MTQLNDNFNPFKKTNIYEQFDMDPWATNDQKEELIETLKAKFEGLSDAEKNQKTAAFQELLQALQEPRNRVVFNAIILDPINHQTIINLLENLPENYQGEDLQFPDLDISQVLVEGDSEILAKRDFTDIEADPENTLEEEDINKILKNKDHARSIYFDV